MIASSPTPIGEHSSTAPAVVFEGVYKSFRHKRASTPALVGMTLRVPAHAVTGLVGPDGAGKTTMMRLIAGLLAPDRGRVEVFGSNLRRGGNAAGAAIGYMPQRFGLYEDLTVEENLRLYGDLQGIPRRQQPERVEALMKMTGLSPFLDRRAGRLSGGMKQKLGLACTLVRSPRLLLLDEPSAGVDPMSRRELWTIIDRIVRDEDVTVLLSTAYIDEAERCAQVAIVHAGRVLAAGSPESLTRTIAHHALSVRPTSGGRRANQRVLASIEGVVDVSVLAEHFHVLAGGDEARLRHEILERLPGASIQAASARLEDAVVTMLAPQGSAASPGPETRPAPLPSRSSSAPEAVISVQKATRFFGHFLAVDRISFDVRRGEIFGLLGANGAGKTTTFRMMCGLLPATSGELRVAGIDLRSAPSVARARIGYVSQQFALYRELTVIQNLRFFASAYGLRSRERTRRISWALEEFDLDSSSGLVSGTLPHGFGQRLAMACALMHEPEVLFLDEPTSGVDPLTRRRFWTRINELAERGTTVLVTTHHVEEAEYCDRLVIMVAGRLAARGTPGDVRSLARTTDHPSPSMEDAFLAVVNEAKAVGTEP